jgi:hypothetical protein
MAMQSSKYFSLINTSRLQIRNRYPVLKTACFFAIYWQIFGILYRTIMEGYTLAELDANEESNPMVRDVVVAGKQRSPDCPEE